MPQNMYFDVCHITAVISVAPLSPGVAVAPRRGGRDPGEVLHDDLGGLRLARPALPADDDGLVRGPGLPSPDILLRL